MPEKIIKINVNRLRITVMEQKVKVTMRPYLGCACNKINNKCKQTEDHSDGTKGQGHDEAILGLCLKNL